MKTFIKNTFVGLGGHSVLRQVNKTPRILFWHGVENKINPLVEQENVEVDIFEKQIAYISRHYEVVSLAELEHRFKNKSFTNKEVVLTFDDGYANNLYVVEPILAKYSLPFTVFVSTEHIEYGTYFPTSVNRIIVFDSGLDKLDISSQKVSFPTSTIQEKQNTILALSNILKTLPLEQVRLVVEDLINNVGDKKWEELKEKYKSVRPMTWDEVREISQKGAEIGSHCMWHTCCHANQKEEDVLLQIQESRRMIEQRISKECKYFAYPNGDYTYFSNSCVEQNYSMGFSTIGKERVTDETNIATIPRIGMPGAMNTFKILLGLYPEK